MMHHTPSMGRVFIRPARRGGFTLMELMVSLGVMAALITMITMVFAAATKSASEAQNLAAAHRQFRMAARNLYEDLEYTLPGDTNECFLAIAGREVNAHETAARRSAGEAATSHRADVLALLTNRQFTSFINQDPAILFGNKQLVVYGHADIGEIDVNTTTNAVTIENITRLEPSTSGGVSDLLAAQWHLARRIIGFPAETIPAAPTNDGVAEVDFANANQRFTQEAFLQADADACNLSFAGVKTLGALPLGALPKGVFHYAGTNSYYLHYSDKWYYKNQLEQWFVFDGGHWFGDPETPSPGDPCEGTGLDQWLYKEESMPDDYACASVPSSATDLPPVTDFPANWFFDTSVPARQRSVIDPTPPLGQDRRMAHHFLPGCSEFKVEFTYDDPRELATEYDSNTLTILGYEWEKNTTDENYKPSGATDIVPAPMPIRWQEVPAGEIYVWSGVNVMPTLYATNDKLQNQTLPLRWPRAIRITLRSYGPLGRLERPIEQTIIHTFE